MFLASACEEVTVDSSAWYTVNFAFLCALMVISRFVVVPVAATGKTVKRRERKQSMQRKQERKEGAEEKSLNADGSSDSEADPDEICSAGKCQRPTGKQIWMRHV